MDNLIQNEVKIFENIYYNYIKDKVDDYLKPFLFAKSKRLRPLLGILFLKSLDIDYNEDLKNHLIAVELIHNASLLHDDVIDNSKERRNQKSLNAEYDNSLAITSGDILLTYAMELILKINNSEVRELFVKNIIEVCQGEINQYFSKFKIPTIEDYVEKCRKKTAMLFETSILGALMISDKTNFYDCALSFSKNFGIAFQIKNDLQNYLTTKDDYNQGVYTAPNIFGIENGIEKTKHLIDNYLDESFKEIEKLSKNNYTNSIKYIVNGLREKNEGRN